MTERAQMPPINPPTSGREPAEVIALADIDPTMIDLVGGKSLGLARMIIAGERVPDGFCVTTRAHSVGVVPRDRVLQAYHHQLGGGPVAVRSSATAEDLADASFAGQQDSYLNVAGDQELINAIERCWASLDNDRAVAYRRDRGWDGQQVAMAVVVQRMVRPRAAGVLFTANPITGTRTEMIIDAVAGLGDVVVDGSAETDHYVLSGDQPVEPHGCLSAADLDQLRSTGRRLEHEFGQPQDIEWAIDDDGLWLLQSRAITTLFPVPAEVAEDDLRVYLEVGHLQGFRRPVTPMGMSVLVKTTQISFEQLGISTRDDLIKDIAGRMFVDLTPFLRNPRLRGRVVGAMDVYGPGIKRSLQRLIDDPRLAPRPGKAFDVSAMIKVLAGALPKQAVGMISTFLVPAAARRRAFRTRDRVRRWPAAPDNLDAAKRIEYAIDAIGPIIGDAMMALIPPLWVGLGSRGVADALFSGIAEPGELDSIGRGMPYNVTTEMDLRLWSVSEAAAEHRELFLNTPPEELARRYLRGELPKIGLEDFLDAYGRRSALEIDVGVPRWEDALRFRVAMSHLGEPGEWPDPAASWNPLPRSSGPYGGVLCATAADVVRLAKLHLDGGVADDGTRILSPQAVSAMQRRVIDSPDKWSVSADGWGLGWTLYDWHRTPGFGHDGATIGQYSFLRVVPDHDVAVALLTNGGSGRRLYSDLMPELLAELAAVRMPPAFGPPEQPVSVDLTAHLGSYRRAGVALTVTGNDETARMRYEFVDGLAGIAPPLEADLVPVSENVFAVAGTGPFGDDWMPLVFSTLSDGTACAYVGMRATPKINT
jgi:hypothetical protein